MTKRNMYQKTNPQLTLNFRKVMIVDGVQTSIAQRNLKFPPLNENFILV